MLRKAILTGGGRATRLRPITTTLNKHLIPLANKPMIFYAIEKVAEVGAKEIAINLNPGETELPKVVGQGERWGVKIHYFEQTGGPQGIAHVVSLARDFVGKEPFIFYLSDNIILTGLRPFVDKFEKEKLNCLLSFAKVNDPERFGVPEFNREGRLRRVLEKPAKPPSNLAQTGIYFYDQSFFKAFKNIKKSPRGEYEISDVNTWLIENVYKVGWSEITGFWKDSGKPIDLLIANRLLLDQMAEELFCREGTIEEGAVLEGKVKIGRGSRVGTGVVLKGPVIIGENCVLDDCRIGPHAAIGNGAEIASVEIENSIIFDEVDIDGRIKISDSIIGRDAVITVSPTEKALADRRFYP